MTPAAPVRRRQPLIGLLLGCALAANVVALCLPFVTLDAAGASPVVYGLFGSIGMLVDAGMLILAALVFAFSVLFPFAKLAILGRLWWDGVETPRQAAWLERVEAAAKWSFFDVFLVALMVALTNDQWLIGSATLPGMTWFMTALVLGMVAGEMIAATARGPARPGARDAGAGDDAAPPSAWQLSFALGGGGMLAAAFLVPFIRIDDWRLADRAYSLVELGPAVWQNDSPALALCLAVVLVAMPALRWALSLAMILGWWRRRPPAALRTAQLVAGRWAMLPVFALSLAVFLTEGDRFLATETRPGVWLLVGCLASSVLAQAVLARPWGTTADAPATPSPSPGPIP